MNDKRKNNGGARPNSGPKPKQYAPGDEPVNTTVQVEPSVLKACKEKHGSYANALRYAAKKKVKLQPIVDRLNAKK